MNHILTTYRGYVITRNPPEARKYHWSYAHEAYDGPGDHRCGIARTLGDVMAEIDEKISEDAQG